MLALDIGSLSGAMLMVVILVFVGGLATLLVEKRVGASRAGRIVLTVALGASMMCLLVVSAQRWQMNIGKIERLREKVREAERIQMKRRN